MKRGKKAVMVLVGISMPIGLCADKIHVINRTGHPVNVAPYYCFKAGAQRAGAITRLAKGAEIMVERPVKKRQGEYDPRFCQRVLVASGSRATLRDEWSNEQFAELSVVPIGNFQGKRFIVQPADVNIAIDVAAISKKLPFQKNKLPMTSSVENLAQKAQESVEQAKKKAQELASSVQQTVAQQTKKIGETVDQAVSSVQAKIDDLKTPLKAVYKNGPLGMKIRREWDRPEQDMVATVELGDQLNAQEQAYIARRRSLVRQSLERSYGISLTDQQVPTIGLCFSGGGYRAMIATLGYMMGAESIGLLDKTMYAVGASGSTWLLFPWLASGLPLAAYKEQLKGKVLKSLLKPDLSLEDVAEYERMMLNKEIIWESPVTLIDRWGFLLAHSLLKGFAPSSQKIYGSEVLYAWSNGTAPVPIGTTVINNIVGTSEYKWFEVTPYELGDVDSYNARIPLWAAGRKFYQGKSINFAPEQPLGYWLGVFGSAFAVSVGDVLDEIDSQVTNDMLKKFLHEETAIEKARRGRVIKGGKIDNYLYALDRISEYARNKQFMDFVDANMEASLPYPPLARPQRAVDIIVMGDVSDTEHGTALQQIVLYAQKHGINSLPPIDGAAYAANPQPVVVFGDPAKVDQQVIVYIRHMKNSSLPTYNGFDPLVAMKNKKETHVTTFDYTGELFERLLGYSRESMEAAKGIIDDVIKIRTEALMAQANKGLASLTGADTSEAAQRQFFGQEPVASPAILAPEPSQEAPVIYYTRVDD